MDKKLAFQVLGISETKEEEQIRQRYLTLLKDTNPEDDPDGFRRLREAYEEALRLSKVQEEGEEEEPQGELDLWMKRVRENYRDIFLRRDVSTWKELFDDPVCIGFDTFLEARGRLLGYLAGHSFLPQTVWQLLDQVFHVLDDFEALKEDFHVNFLGHIEYHVHTEDFLDYSLFEGTEDGYAPENDEDTDEYIREYFQIKNKLEENETEGILQALSDLKRHGLYHPYEDVERLRLFIRTDECEQVRELAEQLIGRYADDNNVRIWAGRVFSHTGEEERAYELWEAVLAEDSDYYIAKYFAMHYLVDQKQWYRAEKYLDDLIRVNRRDEELLEIRQTIGKELVPMLQEAVAEGKDFEDLSGKELTLYLGWCLFDLERYEDTLVFVEEQRESLDGEEKYYELRAWTLYKLERYEEAIPVYQAHLKSVEESQDEEEKKASKAAQSHRLLGVCFYCMEQPEEGEKETRIAIEMEPESRIRLDCKQYLADRYLSAKEYEKATEVCDGILSEDENYYPAYLVRQEAGYYLRRAQQVVDDYYRAIDLYAGYDRPYLYAVMVFYDYRQYKDALGVIERARENQVEFSKKLRFQEAKVLRMLAEDEEARKKPMEILDALLYETEEDSGELKQASGRSNDTLDRAELLFEKGLVFEDDRKLVEAIVLVQEALKLDPEEPYYHLALGNLFRDSENYKDALTEYEKVEEVYHHPEFYFGMGVCHHEAKAWTEAIQYYTKAVERDENYRDTNRRLYQCYEERYSREYRRADYEQALKYINKQLEISQSPGYRYWDRGYLYSSAMEIEAAVADYEKAMTLVDEADRYLILENIGFAYKKGRQFAKSYEFFRRAVDCMKPEDASARGYAGMTECCMKMGDYEKAIACCKEGLAVFPANGTLWENLSDCYAETDRLQEAMDVADKWRFHTGGTKAYWNQVAFILLKMGKVRESLDTYKEAKAELIKNAADKEELAGLYEKWAGRLIEVQNYAEAVKRYQDAAALYQDNWDIFDCECELAKTCYLLGDYEQAGKHAKKVLDCIAKRNTTLEDYASYAGYVPIRKGWVAWIYLALGEKEKGRRLFEEMEKEHPCASCKYTKCFESSLWLGFYYYCEKEYEKAAELFEETLRRNEDELEAKFMLEKMKTGTKTEETTKKGWKGLFREK